MDRVISQLDMLVPYLSLAHERVFELVESEYDNWCPTPRRTPMPDTFDAFKTQIAHAAFVLGFSYADAFLADLIKEIYYKHPEMLPQKKKLSFETIINARSYDEVLRKMVNHEVHEAMHNGIEKIAEYFKEKFGISWPETEKQEFITASLIRNCIIHNNACANDKLSEKGNWSTGQRISLAVSDVHKYGIAARRILRHVYQEAASRHLER
ncbi:MAG: hypothetical protein KAR44_09800 [Candidatus Aegiribacteria sp.]|nr:hypothetical protein [Candidatus Aegiribacteria sp.]